MQPIETDGDELVPALFRIGRRWRRLAGSTTEIEAAGFVVLHRIACRGPVRSTEVAAGLELDASTVSRHVRALEHAGLVHRDTDPDDRRAQNLSLTDAGKQMLVRAIERRRGVLEAAVQQWSEGDRDLLKKLLLRLADDLEALDSAPTAEPFE